MGKITSAAFQLNDSGTPTHMLSGDGQQVNVVTATTDAVTGAVKGTIGSVSIAETLALNIAEGGALDTALNALILTLRSYATANDGRAPLVVIPGGNYIWSATNSTVTFEPWMRFKLGGNISVAVSGLTVPAIWLRNDPAAGQIVQGNTDDWGNAKVIDGSNGVLRFVGNLSAGGCAIRIGNGDGVWGSAYAGSSTYVTAFSVIEGIYAFQMDNAVQFTNNNVFCTRFLSLRASGCNKVIVTSTGAFANAGEQHTFINSFFNNTVQAQVQFNGPGAGTEGHQLTFLGGSLTFCGGPILDFTVANGWNIEFIGTRLENFTYVSQSSNATAAPAGSVRLTGASITPSSGAGSPTATYLRRMFTGTHTLQMTGVRFSIIDFNYWNLAGIYGNAANQFLCDSTVSVQAANLIASEPLGLFSANANCRNQPICNLDSALNYNADFELAIANSGSSPTSTLDGKTWTANVDVFGQTSPGSTINVDTGANNFFTGAQGVKIDSSAAKYGNICSGLIAVRAGKTYYGDLVARCASGASANLIVIPQVVWYASDGTTQVGTTQAYNQHVDYQNWFNVISATAWKRHPTGTGPLRAPSGAAYARVIWNFCASTGTVSTSLVAPTNAIWYVDSAPFVEL